jgi:hypothetical protein
MPMPYTDEQLEELAQKAEDFDPSKARVIDASPIRDIAEATEQIRRAQARQLEAVQIARARGISWNLIALALGVSRQAARQRLAKPTVSMDAVQKAIADLNRTTEAAMANLERAAPNLADEVTQQALLAISAVSLPVEGNRARLSAKKGTARKATGKRTTYRKARG